MSFNQPRCKAFSNGARRFTICTLVASLAAVATLLVLP